MIIEPIPLQDAAVIHQDRFPDDRGYFSRLWIHEALMSGGAAFSPVETNLAHNEYRGTLRGMHYQEEPHSQAKLVTCVRGAIYDVIVDLRPYSSTHGQWFGVELSERQPSVLFVPRGFAHGYISMEDRSTVLYHMSAEYAPETARGFRWDDPYFDINLPVEVTVISERDRNYPDYRP